MAPPKLDADLLLRAKRELDRFKSDITATFSTTTYAPTAFDLGKVLAVAEVAEDALFDTVNSAAHDLQDEAALAIANDWSRGEDEPPIRLKLGGAEVTIKINRREDDEYLLTLDPAEGTVLDGDEPGSYYVRADVVDAGIVEDEAGGCPGHESTDGPIGNVIYCDGSCCNPPAAKS